MQFPPGTGSQRIAVSASSLKRSETGKPIEIGWFINGQAVESVPLSCDVEWAKQLAIDVIDERIPVDQEWQQAGKRDQEPDLS